MSWASEKMWKVITACEHGEYPTCDGCVGRAIRETIEKCAEVARVADKDEVAAEYSIRELLEDA